jgi:hypothetical protein
MPAVHAHVRMVLNAAVKSTNTWELESIVAAHTSAGSCCVTFQGRTDESTYALRVMDSRVRSRRRGSARSGRRVKRWDRTQSRLVDA